MTLRELAAALDVELVGASGDEEVLGVAGVPDAARGYVTYAEDERHLVEAEASLALAIIAGPGLASSKPLLVSANPRLSFARALALAYPPSDRLAPGVHATAQIGEGVSLGEGVAVGPYVVIGDGVRIGARTQVHPFVSVGAKAVVGEDCVFHPSVTLYQGVRIGSRVVLHAGSVVGSPGFGYVWDGAKHEWIPQVGTVVIEDDVEIGANTCIDRATTGATVIGRGTKIDNLVQVAHNVVIGEHCLIAGQAGLAGSVKLEAGVALAGQAGVADHVTMGKGSAGAAGADIIRDVPAGQTVIGRPARPIKQQMRIDAAAAHLPEMLQEIRQLRKQVTELERKLGER